MGFSSMDDLIDEITTNGKFNRTDWNKITGAATYTAGRWYDFSGLAGTPVANALVSPVYTWKRMRGNSSTRGVKGFPVLPILL